MRRKISLLSSKVATGDRSAARIRWPQSCRAILAFFLTCWRACGLPTRSCASPQQELRWHLAVMIPRLMLSAKERQAAIGSLNSYLEDRSSMVKTFALQGLTDLAHNDPGIRPEVIETLREAARNGAPAMKARSRKLLFQLERV